MPKLDKDNISSLSGFADRVRKFKDKSSTNNTYQEHDNSVDDKSGVSVEEYQNYKRNDSNAFYEKGQAPRRSLSYNKNTQNPSFYNNSSESSVK